MNPRFAPFVGQLLAVRTTWDTSSPIVGELLAVEPAGRCYFLHLRVNGRPRFVNTTALLELAIVDPAETTPTSEHTLVHRMIG